MLGFWSSCSRSLEGVVNGAVGTEVMEGYGARRRWLIWRKRVGLKKWFSTRVILLFGSNQKCGAILAFATAG